jgi:hypothetical protein
MPNLAPTRLASVDLPVPDVPASKTITFTLLYMSIEATKKSFIRSGLHNSQILKAFSSTLVKALTGIVIF